MKKCNSERIYEGLNQSMGAGKSDRAQQKRWSARGDKIENRIRKPENTAKNGGRRPNANLSSRQNKWGDVGGWLGGGGKSRGGGVMCGASAVEEYSLLCMCSYVLFVTFGHTYIP